MEADFSGYATKAGLKCSDGRTILPDAFKHQDTKQVPLVWQHNHDDPENVLGHAILEHRSDGVYCYGFFNNTAKAQHAREMVQHKDITMMSIWANDLIERAKNVLHGAIREVSLVLSGANPGALIDNVALRHSDGEVEELEDQAIIYTGLSFDQAESVDDAKHGVDGTDNAKPPAKDANAGTGGDAKGSDTSSGDEETVQDVYDAMDDKQKDVVHYLISEALSASGSGDNAGDKSKSMAQDNTGKGADDKGNNDQKGNKDMGQRTNVFENTGGDKKHVISHADMEGIIADATRTGSLAEAVKGYALAHGIENIDTLFPEAAALDSQPQFLSRRVEWVNTLLSAVRKSPFSRIKTLTADITLEDARAKGYVKGNLKKEEFFEVVRRVTTPTTIYKKQSIDRDDVVDITDFDVVVWLKGEMRLMLDEELARAILMGDGRDVSSEDKINEQNIRPIAKEHELFASTITVNLGDANSSISEVTDAFIAGRWQYKGTGTPTMFASETLISKYLLLRDTLGRRIYNSIDDVANELRVSAIVPVEAMEDDPTLLAIIVNPVDYVVGATAGGQVSLFDFFDIDYNKQKYLIETRCSGALTRLKSAIIIRQANATDTAVTPDAPTYDAATAVVTIPATAGVVYQNSDTGAILAAGDQPALAVGEALNVIATASAGNYIPSTEDDHWHFVNNG
jgi:HK97 family phage prohead protease